MKKTLNQLKQDAIGEFKDHYAFEFKEFKQEHDKLLSNPNCGICIKGFFNKVRKDPQQSIKLKSIYGKAIEVDLSSLAISWRIEEVTDSIKKEYWEKWFNSNMLTDEPARCPKIKTAVVVGNDVIVSYTKSIKTIEN